LDQLHTITLFGKPYTFKTEAPTAQAEQVMERLMREVSRLELVDKGDAPRKNENAILISAALNIANECYELKSQLEALGDNARGRAERIIRRLEAI
jgi:cell division protein ZapA (FtsZ GTPase activity inhibitor)